MATTPGGGEGKRRPVMPFVAYGIVLGSLGWGVVFLWTAGGGSHSDSTRSHHAASAVSKPTQIEPLRNDRRQGPAVQSADAGETAPTKREPQQETAVVSPSPPPAESEAVDKNLAASTSKQSEPALAKCTLDPGPWPADKTEQARTIQILLRDLGFYGGTTYGTLGPATRQAIRKFQLAVDEAETGEPSELLFESIKKKCASSSP
jgi:putative peptidoglycan binding protein